MRSAITAETETRRSYARLAAIVEALGFSSVAKFCAARKVDRNVLYRALQGRRSARERVAASLGADLAARIFEAER